MENDENYYESLAVLGLNRLAIACYISLYEHGRCKAGELAQRLGKQRANLYVPLEQLRVKGLVSSIKSEVGPQYFGAVPLEIALLDYHAYIEARLRSLLKQQRAQRSRYRA